MISIQYCCEKHKKVFAKIDDSSFPRDQKLIRLIE